MIFQIQSPSSVYMMVAKKLFAHQKDGINTTILNTDSIQVTLTNFFLILLSLFFDDEGDMY